MKRWSRASSLGALILVAAVSATASPVTASAASTLSTAPRNEVTVVSPSSANLQTGTWTSPTTTVQESAITWIAGNNQIILDWQDLVRLTPQNYETSPDTTAPGRPRLQLAGNRTCGDGTLFVHDVSYIANQDEPVSFAATWQGDCESADSTVVELRYNSSSESVRFGSARLGQDSPVRRIPFTASEVGTGGQMQWHGDLTIDVVTDTCKGKSFQIGDTCYIDAAARPLESKASFQILVLFNTAGERLATASTSVLGTETAEGAYTPLSTPKRLVDTRTNNTPLRGGVTRDIKVTGANGIPATGVAAVVLNITVVSPTANGNLTAYPAGQSPPTASSVNFNRGWTGANLVTVRPGAGGVDGKVRLLTSGGTTNVIVDVVGYYRTAAGWTTTPRAFGSFQPVEPYRLFDSRQTAKVDAQDIYDLTTDYGDDVNSRTKALALNVTVVAPEGPGHLTVWNGLNSTSAPNTSTLNFTAGRTVPNMTVVPVTRCYEQWCNAAGTGPVAFSFSNGSSRKVHVIVDVVGVFDDNTLSHGSRIKVLPTAKRILDTRSSLGFSPLKAQATGTGGTAAVRTPWTTSLSGNLTAAAPTAATALTIWSAELERPEVSSMNPYANQFVSNMVMPGTSRTGQYKVHNGGNGMSNVILDVVGTFEFYRAIDVPVESGVIGDAGARALGASDSTIGPLPAAEADQQLVPRKADTTQGVSAPRVNVR